MRRHKNLNKILALIITACLLFFIIISIAFAQTPQKTYAALGDSIVTGYGLTNPDSDIFVNKLAQKTDMKKYNFGVDGMTSSGLLNEINSLSENSKSIISNASLITVSTGGNDILESLITDNQADSEANMAAGVKSFSSNFPQIISALKTLNPNAIIIVQTVYNPLDNLKLLSNMSVALEPALQSINTLITQNAASGGYKVADVYTAFKLSNAAGGTALTNAAANDIHPNAAGHHLIYLANYLALTGKLPYALTADVTNAKVSFSTPKGLNLHVLVTANQGYIAPKTVNFSVNGTTQSLALTNNQADIPATALTGDLTLQGTAIKSDTTSVSKTTATPTASAILVNQNKVAITAYQISGNNYFKLRDLAQLLNGTAKQFAVNWNADFNAINLTRAEPYTALGGELAKNKNDKTQIATASNAALYADGQKINITAYNIGGNNYFKLRDLANALNFGVTWNASKNSVAIDTATGYGD